MKLGAKRVELVQLMKKFVPRNRIRVFRNERTRSPHWTLNSRIGAFCSLWVHFGLFHYCMKLGAKHAELEQLMQKFVPQIRIGFFCSESTRSTPLDPKLMFWCVSYYLGVFGTVFCPTTLNAKWVNWCKSLCHEVASKFFATNTTDLPPLDPKLMFLCVLYYLGAFGTVWLPYETRGKTF